MSQNINLKNPYTLPLRDTERQYNQLWEKKVLTPADIHEAEKLMKRIKFLQVLVGAKNAR